MVDRLQFAMRNYFRFCDAFAVCFLFVGGEAMEKEYYGGIDVIKFFCALAVVVIHTEPFADICGILNSVTVNSVCRVAVPFFFMSSGFLLFGNPEARSPLSPPVKKYVKRILFMYLMWSAVYFPFTVLEMSFSGGADKALGIFLGYIKNMIFSAGYGFLWYLPATAVAVLLMSFFLSKKVNTAGITALASVLYFIGLLGQDLFVLIRPLSEYEGFWTVLSKFYGVIGTTRNGVFEGFLFVAAGTLLARRKKKHEAKKSFVLFCLSLLLLTAESALASLFDTRLEYDMYIMLVPCAYFLFETALGIGVKCPKLCRLFRSYSSAIYFTHMLVFEFIRIAEPVKLGKMTVFALTLVGTFAVSTVMIKLAETKHGKFLKKII